MIKLKKVKLYKFKSFEQEQEVEIQDKITTVVGMNESGKTAFLESLAKVNYFDDDPKFKFNEIFDYPRRELKKYQRQQQTEEVIKCTFYISDDLLKQIQEDIGANTFKANEFELSIDYGNNKTLGGIDTNLKEFWLNIVKKYSLNNDSEQIILGLNTININDEIINTIDEPNAKEALNDVKSRIFPKTTSSWPDLLASYIWNVYLSPNVPKFWYYDEYYALPSRININQLNNAAATNRDEAIKTSKALFELADIDIKKLLQSQNFEEFVAELEATSALITDQLFKYWSTNRNLDIEFKIEIDLNTQEKILNIRIKNQKYKASLPLDKRSKGFNWFFSFIVWFCKIQADNKSNYILLMDEPGINLHASAQADLMRFINDLADKYQIIYTTHSPFMIDSDHLEQVRTVVDTDNGSIISNSIQEKDPDTLFPLQAALGYDIAQNLFISKNNLLVEGPADLLYLSVMSTILESIGRNALKPGITIVPIGGMDKVSAFISLLRGNQLRVVTLLDSFRDNKGQQRVMDLVKNKIIKEKNIRFYHEFVVINEGKADIEDLFDKEEYLTLFNQAFTEYADIKLSDLDNNIPCILQRINKYLNIERFNHYRPAYQLARLGVDSSFFSKYTLDRFDNLFIEINKLF